jgi:YD repeat-containing protein
MPPASLPILEPFSVPGSAWSFTDSRDVEERPLNEFHRAWTYHMARIFTPRGADLDDYVCGHRKLDEENKRFSEAKQADSNLTRDDYDQRDNRRRHTDLDGSRPELFLCAADADGEPIGGLTVTNIDIESSNAQRVDVAGIMALGVPYAEKCGPTWAPIYDRLINAPIPARDGLEVNFVQYECTYLNPPDSEFDEFLGLLGQTTEIIGEIDNALPGPQHVLVRRPA